MAAAAAGTFSFYYKRFFRFDSLAKLLISYQARAPARAAPRRAPAAACFCFAKIHTPAGVYLSRAVVYGAC